MDFGISTHLFHGEALARPHLERIKANGFDRVEVFATRTHVDYGDEGAVTTLRGWLDDIGMAAWSVHAPICDGFRGGVWGRAYSNASTDAKVRDEAVAEILLSVGAARRLGAATLVLHLGLPVGQPIPANDNDRESVRRTLEPVAEACDAAGVRLALEVIPNALATADAVAAWLESDLDLGRTGACLDVGHAHMTGGAPEAAERLAGHLVTTHIHDNGGHSDDHLVPFDGTIDWPMTLLTLSKVGYRGPLIFEVPDHGDATRTLARAVSARQRIQAILDGIAAPFPFRDDQ
jgi:sugar phosphate isomerase/epimerase